MNDDRLLTKSTTDYDSRGRVYRSTTYAVDPTTGQLTGESRASNVWYDVAGQVIKRQAAGSQTFTKTVYDGLGRSVPSKTCVAPPRPAFPP